MWLVGSLKESFILHPAFSIPFPMQPWGGLRSLGGAAPDAVADRRLRQVAARRLVLRHQYWNDLVAVPAIDVEMSVQREDS